MLEFKIQVIFNYLKTFLGVTGIRIAITRLQIIQTLQVGDVLEFSKLPLKDGAQRFLTLMHPGHIIRQKRECHSFLHKL